MSEVLVPFSRRRPRSAGLPAHFVVSVVVIFGLAYILGRSLLDGPLPGDQSPVHLAYADWLNGQFPDIPTLYLPEGGESSASGQSIFAHLIVVVTHRVSGLSLPQAYRLTSFLTFPLTSLGIYFLAWTISRKRTVALLGAGFYLLAPLTWTWVYHEGRLPTAVALVFVPASITCFDQFLIRQVKRSDRTSRRIWLIGTILSLSAASLIDSGAGSAAAVAILIYALFRAVISPQRRRRESLARAGWAAISPILISVLLVTLFTMPGQQPDPETSGSPDPTPSVHLSIPPVGQLVGLSPLDPSDGTSRLQFPLAVILAFSVGTVGARFYSPRMLSLCLSPLPGFAILLFPDLLGPAASLPFAGTLLGGQVWLLITTLLIPIGAAFGAWAVAWIVVHPGAFLQGRRLTKKRQAMPRLSLEGQIASGLALAFSGAALLGMGTYGVSEPNKVPYGPLAGGINIADVWETGTSAAGFDRLQQLALENWPALEIRDDPSLDDEDAPLTALVPDEDQYRGLAGQPVASPEEPSLGERLAGPISIAGFGLLVLLLLDGLFLKGWGYDHLRDFLRRWAPRPFLGEGPIHDWVERKQAEIKGEEAPALERHPHTEPSAAAAIISQSTAELSMHPRREGRVAPEAAPDPVPPSAEGGRFHDAEFPADLDGTSDGKLSAPDWVRRLNEQEGRGAGEILRRRRRRA